MDIESVKQSKFPGPHKGPCLVFFSHGKRGRLHSFFNLSEGRSYMRNIPELRQKYCIASTHGWLFMEDCKTADCLLINLVSMETIHPPRLPGTTEFNYSRSKCVLSASPTDPNFVILFISALKPIILYWHRLSDKWKKLEYKMGVDGGILWPVACNGKVYGMTWNINGKLVVINFNPNPYVNVLMESIRPSIIPFARTAWTSYMVESCGEMFFVCKIYACDEVVRTIEVFKLDFSSGLMKMVGVESIGDRAFFLPAALSCSASESKIKGDCIYYINREDPSILYRFDMADKSITMDQPCPNLITPWYHPDWILPSF